MSTPTSARGVPPAAYQPGDSLDEAFTPDGRPRAHYQSLLDALSGRDLDELARAVADRLRRDGVTFGGRRRERPFRVDPVPRVIEAGEWADTSAGLIQRARALTAFLADAYGDRRIVAAGRLPDRVIDSAVYHEPLAKGLQLHEAGLLAGLDLVRGGDGRLRVLEDNARTPSGLGYAAGARAAVDEQLGDLAPAGRMRLEDGFGLIASALRAAAPDGAADPFVVLLTDGPGNSAWFEHRLLATTLDIPLVTPEDLTVRAGRLHAVVDGRPARPIDVVYRRTDEDRLSDAAGRRTWLADLLLPSVHSGAMTVVNPMGSGLADDKLVHAYVEEFVRFYLGEEPLLRSVRTYDLGDGEQLAEALDRLGDLVVKPRDGYGGEGVVLCPTCSAEELRDVERRVREEPDSFVAQEMVSLSTHPTVVEGRMVARHVDLRPFVVGGGHESATVPGALTRVAFRAGEMVVNSSREGGGKDTWVMA